MPSSSRRAADYLAERLYQAGCRRAYGMPGGEVLTLMDALSTAGIQVILVKHENSACFNLITNDLSSINIFRPQ